LFAIILSCFCYLDKVSVRDENRKSGAKVRIIFETTKEKDRKNRFLYLSPLYNNSTAPARYYLGGCSALCPAVDCGEQGGERQTAGSGVAVSGEGSE
jgi:hypothetical protein